MYVHYIQYTFVIINAQIIKGIWEVSAIRNEGKNAKRSYARIFRQKFILSNYENMHADISASQVDTYLIIAKNSFQSLKLKEDGLSSQHYALIFHNSNHDLCFEKIAEESMHACNFIFVSNGPMSMSNVNLLFSLNIFSVPFVRSLCIFWSFMWTINSMELMWFIAFCFWFQRNINKKNIHCIMLHFWFRHGLRKLYMYIRSDGVF